MSALPKEKWIDLRSEDVPDAPYFHVVFTMPEELNLVIYSNQSLLYNALYHAASDTLGELSADGKYLGAKTGYLFILHTWGSEMNYHPHIHAIVLGGGLNGKKQWRDRGEEFFLPARAISRVFRGKYMETMKGLWKDGKLEFHGPAGKYILFPCFYPHGQVVRESFSYSTSWKCLHLHLVNVTSSGRLVCRISDRSKSHPAGWLIYITRK